MLADRLLKSIGSTEETSFKELCFALGDDCPEDRKEWAELFRTIEKYERNGWIEVSRVNEKIDSMILTEAGVAKVNNHGN